MSASRASTRRRCSSAVGAHDLDVDCVGAGPNRHQPPVPAGQRPGIDAVGNDEPAQAKVVLRDRMGDRIALGFDVEAGPPERLLDRVDPHVQGARAAGQHPGDGGLAHTGQAAEDDEHLDECTPLGSLSLTGHGRTGSR